MFKVQEGLCLRQESIAAGGASLIGSGYSLTRAALATTCGKTLGLWCKRSNPTEAEMGTIRFGDGDAAMVAAVLPQKFAIVRGMNGCAMASDRI
jgi:hypothetical protein